MTRFDLELHTAGDGSLTMIYNTALFGADSIAYMGASPRPPPTGLTVRYRGTGRGARGACC
ncbi:hypothetical protein E1267_34040 [Nonomuraea longispora]|uniref:Uncharacterized protein n=1 Tax=Nonomuraea longispora TaxID=1848320 RepID=A0A4R4MWR4_9ACTN|nr:hypothetical protein [Nonomuraea longispora]TDC00669.1 hypothetical protein E1267_34040 [Nonomuraea longispora]